MPDAADRPATIGGLLIRRLARLDDASCRLLQARNVATVSTHAADGGIHAQPVWVDTDGTDVLLNSVDGRAWVRNLRRDPHVTCTIVDLANPYEFVEVRGRASTPQREGADAHIHHLAQKYLGVDEYPWMDPGQPRVLVRVTPERVVHMHPGDPELEA